jgi:hypothetical protein
MVSKLKNALLKKYAKHDNISFLWTLQTKSYFTSSCKYVSDLSPLAVHQLPP